MRRFAAVALILLAPALAHAQAKVKGEAVYQPHKKIVLKATDVTSAKAQFLWRVDSKAADLVKAGDTLYVWAPPGVYNVSLVAVDFEKQKLEEAEFSFRVGDPEPPKPPIPPTPPEPTGPLFLSLKAAYQKETSTDKAKYTADLSALYTAAAGSTVNDTSLATLGHLFAALVDARKTLMPDDAVLLVRKAIQTHLKATLPTEVDTPLTADLRARCGAEFARVGKALEAVK